MKLAITGQATLAAATRTCCERHFSIVEPSEADLLWICYDTPIGPGDVPDVEWVVAHAADDITKSQARVVLLSSQVPVGTTGRLAGAFPNRLIAYSPENIRVATAVTDFERQARIVVGRRNTLADGPLQALLRRFTDTIIWTNFETAEMVKHALNAYLGMSIAFINEIADVAKAVGADPAVISKALKTEARVSPNAPLMPGKPYGGGHLARDLWVLNDLAVTHGLNNPILAHVPVSNAAR